MEVRKVKCLHCNAVFYIDKAGEHNCPEPEPRFCSMCGIDEELIEYGSLTDFTVTCADGEEGYANITQLLCWDNGCAGIVSEALRITGFRDHEHGGINFLEDETCKDGYGKCEFQSEYGNVIVLKTWPKYKGKLNAE